MFAHDERAAYYHLLLRKPRLEGILPGQTVKTYNDELKAPPLNDLLLEISPAPPIAGLEDAVGSDDDAPVGVLFDQEVAPNGADADGIPAVGQRKLYRGSPLASYQLKFLRTTSPLSQSLSFD